jgi:CelD/BcsL family acetyltransferase involved in cellulose biosynthesis
LPQPETRVETRHTFGELVPYREAIDALNRASRRPSAASTFDFLRALADHDEQAAEAGELLFLLVFRGRLLLGLLPLRTGSRRMLGFRVRKIGLLASHDADTPQVIARAEDARSCALACYAHLARHERWSWLEFVAQDAGSPFWPPPLPAWRFHCRRYLNLPTVAIPLGGRTLPEYYESLSADFRKLVARTARRLYKAGRLEAVSCEDTRAGGELLELYLALERRSWKRAANAGIARHPERLAFFRRLCEPGQATRISATFVLLDGVPIGALLSGVFEGHHLAFETSYDSAYAELAPGHFTWLMGIRYAMEQGLQSYNVQGAYSYYKERWHGELTPTWAVQAFRIPSIPWIKALLGTARGWLPRRRLPTPDHNELRRKVEAGVPAGDATSPDRRAAALATADVFRRLEARDIVMERLAGPSLLAATPFALEANARPAGRTRVRGMKRAMKKAPEVSLRGP